MSARPSHRPYDIRKDIAILVDAREGKDLLEMWRALVVCAVDADNGDLLDSTGGPGFAWDPKHYAHQSDPVEARTGAAAASLGRILYSGRGNFRTCAAYSEAAYYVTMNQGYDVTSRIERLWDATPPAEDVIPTADYRPVERRGFLRRILDRLFGWMGRQERRAWS